MVNPDTGHEWIGRSLVARCEHDGNPNGKESWLEMERIYGGRARDELPAQLLGLKRRLWDLLCISAEEPVVLKVSLDTVQGEFEALGEIARAEETKRATLLLGIKEALHPVFI